MKIKTVTIRVKTKNMIKSAKTIPVKYDNDLIPIKFMRYLNLNSLSVTAVIKYIPGA